MRQQRLSLFLINLIMSKNVSPSVYGKARGEALWSYRSWIHRSGCASRGVHSPEIQRNPLSAKPTLPGKTIEKAYLCPTSPAIQIIEFRTEVYRISLLRIDDRNQRMQRFRTIWSNWNWKARRCVGIYNTCTPHSRRSDRNGGIKVVCIFQAITGKPTKLAYFKTMDLNGKNS